jgi:3-methyladenine DNA glycosylase AlkC
MISPVFAEFQSERFVRESLSGYEPLNLMQRGKHIAAALHRNLPDNFERAAEVLIASLGPKLTQTENFGMSPFLYLPYSIWIAEHGLSHFAASMRVLYELTQRFTAEFCIRPFLQKHREATLAQLVIWATDPSPHVRRLVSEGTRPRLPWASRLPDFQRDPAPVLHLLEKLKDDPSLYVRRSVANNLNDIGKDHPDVMAETAKRWLRDASPEREWIVRHALRSAVKRGEAGALDVLGFGGAAKVEVRQVEIEPAQINIGGTVAIAFELHNPTRATQQVLADLRIHYIKANGKPGPKVFKLKVVDLPPEQRVRLVKNISLTDKTTRKHYPGRHTVEVLLNGRALRLGEFYLGVDFHR